MDHSIKTNKVFIEFATVLLLFYVLALGRQACGLLASRPGTEPTPPTLEGNALTTGPPGKSSIYSYIQQRFDFLYQALLQALGTQEWGKQAKIPACLGLIL